MCPKKLLALIIIMALAVGLPAFSMVEQRFIRPPTPPTLQSTREIMSPTVLSSGADTIWVQVHTDSSYCPGDPLMGHGGEATGGPGPLETWCFEGGPGDSCGTNPPWDVRCFDHIDVRAVPSATGVNYWHVDTYRADQRAYCGNYSLWCGSDFLWDGVPVECGTWQNPPGYGDQWNCVVQLTLPDTFSIANGCTLLFDPRYDTECKYDYFYVDFWDGGEWQSLATFNATSSNPGPECGGSTGGNPDYFGNTDIDRLVNVDWQDRADPACPAFAAEIDSSRYSHETGPMFRWRFVSDGSVSDADGRGNTDGGAWIDNVWVLGDSAQYNEDFEAGLLDDEFWSLPDPDGVVDLWHVSHDPDPPYEGGDGGERATCRLDSSQIYRGRPEYGYEAGADWRNGWFYRLMSPSLPMLKPGCVVQYDNFRCTREYTCDFCIHRVRFYRGDYGTWCPWIHNPFSIWYGCFFWDFDTTEDWGFYAPANAESVQYCWDLMDASEPGQACRGKHARTEYQIDNVSAGFYDIDATNFRLRTIDMLQDMFFTNLCAFNSFFEAYNEDTLEYYADQAHPYPAWYQLYVEVTDPDDISAVELYGTISEGDAWVAVPMTLIRSIPPSSITYGGEYAGTLCPGDFSLAEWDTGTAVWYYIKCTDGLSNEQYFPQTADPTSPSHTGTVKDYFEFSILPMYTPEFTGAKILLVDGYGRENYDYSPCLSRVDNIVPLEDIYGRTLADAGYCYDKYDICGAGSSVHVHYLCTWNTDYDAVVWFTGPYFAYRLFDAEAQIAMRDYLNLGGKVVLCGDRAAYCVAPEWEGGGGEDSIGEFLSGIMGADYLGEMVNPFSKPYIYCAGVGSVAVFGTPTAVDFDTLLVYRECPYLKDMSWIKTEVSPPAGYVAQPLLAVLNPDVPQADMVTYAEYMDTGQSVLINFDLSGAVNHTRAFCSGGSPGTPVYEAGVYEGRVDLMRLILEDIFGLAPSGGGTAGNRSRPDQVYGWRLGQNSPNPCIATTHIRFELPRRSKVKISIYDALGRSVRVLVDEIMEPGEHTVQWDGRNTSGQRLSSGVYFYRMHSEGFSATRKMLVVD